MDGPPTDDAASAGDLDPAVALARELLHRSNALAVRLAVDRGAAGTAIVACERFGPVEVFAGERTLRVRHDAELPLPDGMPDVPGLPVLQVDPVEGRVAGPLGGVQGLADALAAAAGLLGGRSVAAAILETDHEDAPLGIAARPGEAPVITLGDDRYELPG